MLFSNTDCGWGVHTILRFASRGGMIGGMAKELLTKEIVEEDVEEFLDENSNFAFEMRVLKQLNDANFICEHGGSYTDPVEKKIRQFDIRAEKTVTNTFRRNQTFVIRLAVECKNLSNYYPLLVSLVPRSSDEAYHHVIANVEVDSDSQSFALELPPRGSAYPSGDPVGKDCSQVGRRVHKKNNKHELCQPEDSEVYNKWSQALQSAADLVFAAARERVTGWEQFNVVLPIVVVPEGCLWAVNYDENGNRCAPARRSKHVSYFCGRKYRFDRNEPPYKISHFDIMTPAGLADLITFVAQERVVERFFSELHLKPLLEHAVCSRMEPLIPPQA